MMKRTILEVMNFKPPFKGNFIPSVSALTDALRERGYDSVYVFPKEAEGRAWISEIEQKHIPVYFLPESALQACFLLRRLCRQYGVRLIHSHFIDHRFYIPIFFACSGRSIPHIFHAHNPTKFPPSGFGTAVRRKLLCAKRVIAVSESVCETYQNSGFPDCVTVPNGIDFQRLDQFETYPKRSPSVMIFGREFIVKGVDTALEALDRFDPEHRIALRICVSNHGDEAEAFLNERYGAVPDWVELLPPRADIATYLHATDVFLSASRAEGLPYAVLEAGYCGKPLVLSDIAPHLELHMPQAEIFPCGDAKALYAALSRAWTQSGAENIPYVKENFSVQKWAEQVLLQLPIESY